MFGSLHHVCAARPCLAHLRFSSVHLYDMIWWYYTYIISCVIRTNTQRSTALTTLIIKTIIILPQRKFTSVALWSARSHSHKEKAVAMVLSVNLLMDHTSDSRRWVFLFGLTKTEDEYIAAHAWHNWTYLVFSFLPKISRSILELPLTASLSSDQLLLHLLTVECE